MAGWRGWMAAVAAASIGGCGAKPVPPVATSDAIPVTLAVAAPAAGAGSIGVAGTVRLKRETALAFNTSGRIAAITVREGEIVRAGDLLARLDPTGLDAASRAAARPAGPAPITSRS